MTAPESLAVALADLGRTRRSCLAIAAAELRDRNSHDPRYAAVWQALALTAVEMNDAERDVLARLDLPDRAELLEDWPDDD